jgi:hypothetical protein
MNLFKREKLISPRRVTFRGRHGLFAFDKTRRLLLFLGPNKLLTLPLGHEWIWIICSVLGLLSCASAHAQVAHDATMTSGNGSGGAFAQAGGTTSISTTGMTVGASATCLIVPISWGTSGGVTSPAVTWNSVSMTLGPSITVGGVVEAALFYLPNPATGNHTLAASWMGAEDVYMSAVSWTGTDTLTCIKTADNATASNVASITITSDANGATVALEIDAGNVGTPTTNFTLIFNANALSPNSTATYAIGGTSHTHNFTGANGSRALVGVHIIAPSGGAACTPTLTLLGVGKCG